MSLPSIHDYLPEYAETFMKVAEQGKWQRNLPWYTVAGGAAGAGELIHKYAPKAGRLGVVGGALAGTAVGLKAGNVIGKKLDERSKRKGKLKTAASKGQIDSPFKTALKAAGTGALGVALGTGAGALLGKGIEKVLTGSGIPPSTYARKLPMLMAIAGGGMGIAKAMWKSRESEALARAITHSRKKN